MKYRAVAITSKSKIMSKNFDTKDEATAWILDLMDKEDIKHYRIIDRKTKDLLETENKQYDKEKTK